MFYIDELLQNLRFASNVQYVTRYICASVCWLHVFMFVICWVMCYGCPRMSVLYLLTTLLTLKYSVHKVPQYTAMLSLVCVYTLLYT